MKFQSVLALALPAIVAGVALPQGFYDRKQFVKRQDNQTTLTPTGPEYKLKTSLVLKNDTSKAKFDNLYVTAYHTGAGLNDAVLVENSTDGATAFLNNTASTGESYQEFDFGTEFPWSMKLDYEPYTAWAPVAIDAGIDESDSHFEFTASGLTVNLDQFQGWIACDWWHTVPQLFWKVASGDYELPESCADVYLVKEDL